MTERFLGFTRTQFLTVLLVVIFAELALFTYAEFGLAQQAADGRQAHAALCVFKHDLSVRAGGSRTFLGLSRAQRIAKYGAALGTIPPSTIRQSLHAQEATLASLTTLRC